MDSGKCSLRSLGWARQRARIRSLRAAGALEPKLQLPADEEAGLEDREYGGDGCGCAEGPGAKGCPGARGVSPGNLGSQGPATALLQPAAVQARAPALAPGLEYIPKKKAKNPMKPVGLAWAIGFPCGILLFLLTKREVDKNRQKQMKALQNMRTANSGQYESQRFKASAPETLTPPAGAGVQS
ncbi:uncharacterized protein LOC144454748 [Phascolarctos cinereus]